MGTWFLRTWGRHASSEIGLIPRVGCHSPGIQRKRHKYKPIRPGVKCKNKKARLSQGLEGSLHRFQFGLHGG